VQITVNSKKYTVQCKVLNRILSVREQVFRNINQIVRKFTDIAESYFYILIKTEEKKQV